MASVGAFCSPRATAARPGNPWLSSSSRRFVPFAFLIWKSGWPSAPRHPPILRASTAHRTAGSPGPHCRVLRSTGWQSSTFLTPEIGLLGGRSGELMVFVGDQLLPTRLPPLGQKAVRAVHLQNDETAWLAGDGGLVLTSGSGGVVWEDAPTPLPAELRHVQDFRTVAAVGRNVWLAGIRGASSGTVPTRGGPGSLSRRGTRLRLTR